jgi:uncharacterized protein (DUF362 family)
MPVVSIQKTKSDGYQDIQQAVERAIADCGGMDGIIRPGYTVILKPNFCAEPNERLSGGITRWEVVKAVADLVRAAGANPIIAESSAAGVNTEDVIRKCEYTHLRDEGYEVVDLKTAPKATIPVPHGKLIEAMNSWELVKNADAIISIPVLKNHDQTEVTLGMKNLKGLIDDTQKKLFHTIGVVDGVVDIIQTVKPVLCVIDGTYGQQGLGPIFGETIRMDLIVASRDIVACDAVGSAVMGYDVNDPMITVEAYNRGLGEKDLDKIEVRGESIASVTKRFKRSNEVEIPGLPPYKLIFDENACTGCRNTVISALMDMKSQGITQFLENKILVVGPVKELPPDAVPENTVLIGKCTNHFKGRGRTVVGCPPGNVFVVQGIVGDAMQVGRRYSDKSENEIGNGS